MGVDLHLLLELFEVLALVHRVLVQNEQVTPSRAIERTDEEAHVELANDSHLLELSLPEGLTHLPVRQLPHESIVKEASLAQHFDLLGKFVTQAHQESLLLRLLCALVKWEDITDEELLFIDQRMLMLPQ